MPAVTPREMRFSALVAALVGLLLLGQPLAAAGYGVVGLTTIFAAVLVAGAFVVGESHAVRWPSAIAVSFVLAVEGFALATSSRFVLLAAQVMSVSFLGFATVMILRRVVEQEQVTVDIVLGGASVYLLVGVFFASIHSLVESVVPGSYLYEGRSLAVAGLGRYPELIYFSFSTLTTLGYGDITPRNPVAQSLSALESVIGQLLLAILIARLVGLHIHHSRR